MFGNGLREEETRSYAVVAKDVSVFPYKKTPVFQMKQTTKDLFGAITRSGASKSSAHFSLKALKTASFKSADVRVVASKKVISSAVSRNRLKRRIRAIFNEMQPPLQAIFFVKKGGAPLPFNVLREEITFLLKTFKDIP